MFYEIHFKHTEISTYKATVEAKSEEEATEIVNRNPFEHLLPKDEKPYDVEGVETKIVKVKKK